MRNISFVTVGHVDHGKSTVIGRLLYELNALPNGKLEEIQANCKALGRQFEYAFLLDALKKEQAEGITLDIARCCFINDDVRYTVYDAPGHIELVKNMVTGATQAEVALLVVDARGAEENTFRHASFLGLLGVKQVIVVVNKIDLVNYDKKAFDSVCDVMREFLLKNGITPLACVPVSATYGANMTKLSPEMPWQTETLFSVMKCCKKAEIKEDLPFRMAVQGVYRLKKTYGYQRIIAGEVFSGKLKTGDAITLYPSNKRSSVKEIVSLDGKDNLTEGSINGVVLNDELIINRGEIITTGDAPLVGMKIRVKIFWLGEKPLTLNKNYVLKCATMRSEARIEEFISVTDCSTAKTRKDDKTVCNEASKAIISLYSPIAFELYGGLSRFVLVDGYEISGGGTFVENMTDTALNRRNIIKTTGRLTADEREKLSGNRGFVVWLTGLSGSGKSTIANAVERELVTQKIPAVTLDGDELRSGINKDLGFSAEDRHENIRRTAEIAKMFASSGHVTLVTLISPFAESRLEAKHVVGNDFFEVYVKASKETCTMRDPKMLYKKAEAGLIENFTTKDSPYEIPTNPDLILDTEQYNEVQCAETLFTFIKKQLE